MIVQQPEFTALAPWYGRLVVAVDDLVTQQQARLVGDVMKLAPRPCLVALNAPTQLVPDGSWAKQLAQVLKAKGYELGHVIDCVEALAAGPAPRWCMELHQVVLVVRAPASFQYLEAFNETIQDLWFIDGLLQVLAYVGTPADLDMVYYLEGLVPNDVPFFVQLEPALPEHAAHNLALLLLADPQTLRLVPHHPPSQA
jgi:hypothetical protein